MRISRLATKYRTATWQEARQDVLLVSAFGAWAVILGLLPVFAFRALMMN